MEMVLITLILLCGLCDWVRGGFAFINLNWRPQWWEYTCKFGYGILIAMLLESPLWLYPIVSILWWIGEKPGFAYPLGWALKGKDPFDWDEDCHGPETWQIGDLAFMPWTSLFIRGAMWGILLFPLIIFWNNSWVPILAMSISMPLAVAIQRFIPLPKYIKKLNIQEPIRGICCGSICLLFGLL